VLAGGFLGAGKTTLLLRAARLLHERGLRAAIVTNDQGASLVDTRMASAAGLDAAEIAGACFCCRFSAFIGALRSLLPSHPDVILAEPVGSCTDISATVLQPLQLYHHQEFHLAPFSVLVDPARAQALAQPDADPSIFFLFQNQLAEADLVLLTKSDLYPSAPIIPGAVARRVSAVTGQGVAAWLDEVMEGRLRAGSRILDIDYARYAEAEAALGWLNWEAQLTLAEPLPPASVAGPLLERLDAELTAAGAPIAHLKIFDSASTGYIRAGICSNGDEPSVEGDMLAPPDRRHTLIINLRARALPEVLLDAVSRASAELQGDVRVLLQQAFQPSPPVPEYRLGTTA
jgi:Ni2+-binding GTPase involved in maturation of urease and hydrogenase